MPIPESATGKIRITSIPAGTAPGWVRDAWVGCVLPCQPVLGEPDKLHDLNRNPQEINGRIGVKVPQEASISILWQHNRKAAEWFRAHGFGITNRECFFFNSSEFEIVSGVRHQTIMVADDMEMGVFELPGR